MEAFLELFGYRFRKLELKNIFAQYFQTFNACFKQKKYIFWDIFLLCCNEADLFNIV